MSQLRSVEIRNPNGPTGWTSHKRAVKYLKRGQARIVAENCIEFIAGDYRATSAARSMEVTREPAALIHGPVLRVIDSTGSSIRTFAPYPYRWEGYARAS